MPGVAATVLIGLALGVHGVGAPSLLERLTPGTLQPETKPALLPNSRFGYAYARREGTIALVVKPVATGQPIRILDASTLRVRHVISVGDRDVCGLTFRATTLVALAGNHLPCGTPGESYSLLRIDTARGRIRGIVSLRRLGSVFPTNLAFGDGFAFVTRPGGDVDSINLKTASVVSHRPRRSLAKGDEIVEAHWLGRDLLAAGSTVVNVRTWQRRALAAGAAGVTAGRDDVVVYGADGIVDYTTSFHRRYSARAEDDVLQAWISGRTLYAQVGSWIDVIDLAGGKLVRTVDDPSPFLFLAA